MKEEVAAGGRLTCEQESVLGCCAGSVEDA